MLRSYRGIILALGLILAGAGEPPQQTAAPEKQQAAENQPSPTPNIAIPPAEPQKAVEPPEYFDPCSQAKDKSSSDLCAQWSAANAARNAADWAWWQMWLSGLGVLGLGVTLWFNFHALRIAKQEADETIEALAIAERNADAATAQVKVAQDTAAAELRPYVYCGEALCGDGSTHRLGEDIPTVTISIMAMNYGKTPAKNVKIVAEWRLFEPAGTEIDHRKWDEVSVGDLPPGFPYRVSFRIWDDVSRNSLQVPARRLSRPYLRAYLLRNVEQKFLL